MITRVPFYPHSSNVIGWLVKVRRWSLMLLDFGSVGQRSWSLYHDLKCKKIFHCLYSFVFVWSFEFWKYIQIQKTFVLFCNFMLPGGICVSQTQILVFFTSSNTFQGMFTTLFIQALCSSTFETSKFFWKITASSFKFHQLFQNVGTLFLNYIKIQRRFPAKISQTEVKTKL